MQLTASQIGGAISRFQWLFRPISFVTLMDTAPLSPFLAYSSQEYWTKWTSLKCDPLCTRDCLCEGLRACECVYQYLHQCVCECVYVCGLPFAKFYASVISFCSVVLLRFVLSSLSSVPSALIVSASTHVIVTALPKLSPLRACF